VYQGRKTSIDPALRAQGMGASDIAKALKIGRASVYRALAE
jgi:DNA-binding IclR family transcriptional regulator